MLCCSLAILIMGIDRQTSRTRWCNGVLVLSNLGIPPMAAACRGDLSDSWDRDQGTSPAEIAHGRAIGQAHLGTGTWTVPSPHHLSISIPTHCYVGPIASLPAGAPGNASPCGLLHGGSVSVVSLPCFSREPGHLPNYFVEPCPSHLHRCSSRPCRTHLSS